jgi:hypothetical protein
MNPNENPERNWTPIWPDRRTALLRLLLIASVVFPLSWAVNALLVGSWNLLWDRNAESVRHLIQWQIAWIATVAVVFILTLLAPVNGWLARFNPRRWIFGIVCVLTLVVLFYAEENWRGARAWNNYRQQLEASGVQLDLAAFVPKPVPDDENFAATPFVKSWFVRPFEWNDNFSRSYGRMPHETKKRTEREFIDLAAWAAAFNALRGGDTNALIEPGKLDLESRSKAAPVVLELFRDDESKFAELRETGRRPKSVYPVVYDLDNPWGILLPHLHEIKGSCSRLQLKACAELALGKTDEALADIQLMLRMADSLKEESCLIYYLVRIKFVQHAVQTNWEGRANSVWSDAQLQEIK